MKRIIFILALALGFEFAQAGVLQSILLDGATTTINTTYNLGDATNIAVPLAYYVGQTCCINTTATDVAVFVDTDTDTTTPTAAMKKDWFLPAGIGSCLPLNTRVTRTIQFRSAGAAAITVGRVYCDFFDRRG